MREIRAITFDLDDTLWAIAPVIRRAEIRIREHVQRHFPRSLIHLEPDTVRRFRHSVERQNPHHKHDLTEMRRLVFEQVLDAGNYDTRHSRTLMDHFFEWRHDVEFFPDVEDSLARLARRFRLFAISNGNADLTRLSIGSLFEGQVNARMAGVGKPDERIFAIAAESLALSPDQILHIGDHPVDDVAGALNAGYKAAWINRTQMHWNSETIPHITCTDLHEFSFTLEAACDNA